jgi:hypothetical protein
MVDSWLEEISGFMHFAQENQFLHKTRNFWICLVKKPSNFKNSLADAELSHLIRWHYDF